MRHVLLIAEIGKHGQIGLGEALPWLADTFKMTREPGVLLYGWNTVRHLNPRTLLAPGQSLAIVSRHGLITIHAGQVSLPDQNFADWMTRPDRVIRAVNGNDPGMTVYVCGGARVFSTFAPLCDGFDIRLHDFDGHADAYLPTMPWQQ